MKEISYLISHYIEAFIIFHYCHSIFKQKKSNFSVFLGFTLCYSILFGIFHFQNIYVNIIASVLAPLFLISYLYDVIINICFFSLAYSLPVNGIRRIIRGLPALLTF
jgi:inner membrane protein involved in colicin E2 resistance